MKSAILMTVLFAMSAQATPRVEKETILCKGIEDSAGYSLLLEAKSNSNVEGKAIAYYATLTNPQNEVSNGMIFGRKEDVMLTLSPKSGDDVKVSGTIYMDEANQNLRLRLDNGRKLNLHLDCDQESAN